MTSKKLLYFSIGFLLACAYLPYVAGGGSFMIDDWQMLHHSFFQKTIYNTFRYWNVENGSGMRPLASLLFAIMPKIFGDNPVGYIILNTGIWLCAIFAARIIIEKYLGSRASWWFVVLAAVPTIASTNIFEPITMIIGTSNILLWSLSLLCLQRYLERGERLYYILTYILLVVALLIYEQIAPLLLLTALLPFVYNAAKNGLSLQQAKADVVKYFSPIVVVLITMSIFQKLIVPIYGVTLSRLSSRPLGDLMRSFARWVFTVIADTPLMLLSSLQHYGGGIVTRVEFWLLLLGVVVFVILLQKNSETQHSSRLQTYFLVIITLTLFACSALSVFSGINMRVEGIENRFLGSTWLMLSVLLSFVFARFARFGEVLGGVVVFLVYFSFSIQVFNYLDNTRVQNLVFNDCVAKLEAAKQRGERVDSAFIVGNVPVYATKNFNNEVIFAYRFDFGGGMRMKTNGTVEMGQVININRDAPKNDTTRFFAAIDRDTLLIGNLTGLMKRPINEKMWWYEYDQFTGQSTLVHITQGTQQIDSILNVARNSNVNAAPLPATERVRNSIKAMFKKS